jgi:hypothetical protein
LHLSKGGILKRGFGLSEMNFGVLLEVFESLVDSILTNDPDKVSNYVDSIRSKNPELTENQIAKKIVGEQSFVNGLLGAGTGAAGLMALPATVPADLVKAWRIQAFTIRCIASASFWILKYQ